MAGGKWQADHAVVAEVRRIVAPAVLRPDWLHGYRALRWPQAVGAVQHAQQRHFGGWGAAIAFLLVRDHAGPADGYAKPQAGAGGKPVAD